MVGAGSDSGVGYTSQTTESGAGFFRIGDHGGQGMHQLTIAEMPSHNHKNGIANDQGGNFVYGATSQDMPGAAYITINDEYHTAAVQGFTSLIGSNQPHNIMPPYYALAYIMKL